MEKIYQDNGLPFYNCSWIKDRQYIKEKIEDVMKSLLWKANRSWDIQQIEAPSMIPNEFINSEYTNDDVYRTTGFTMKPETTGSSYEYAKYLLKNQLTKPPICIWQASKSFRKEQDQVISNVRLKEFYQQEFQCIYTEDTKKDYHELLDPLKQIIEKIINKETRIIKSERLPSYSLMTMDIEVKMPTKWLEVMSSSKRIDVPFTWGDKKLLNTEFAFGLDRLCYCMQN